MNVTMFGLHKLYLSDNEMYLSKEKKTIIIIIITIMTY